ncbi:MAG: hypothetical protein RIQ56_630, partial [Candidatus Parcubacteria bacterium]
TREELAVAGRDLAKAEAAILDINIEMERLAPVIPQNAPETQEKNYQTAAPSPLLLTVRSAEISQEVQANLAASLARLQEELSRPAQPRAPSVEEAVLKTLVNTQQGTPANDAAYRTLVSMGQRGQLQSLSAQAWWAANKVEAAAAREVGVLANAIGLASQRFDLLSRQADDVMSYDSNQRYSFQLAREAQRAELGKLQGLYNAAYARLQTARAQHQAAFNQMRYDASREGCATASIALTQFAAVATVATEAPCVAVPQNIVTRTENQRSTPNTLYGISTETATPFEELSEKGKQLMRSAEAAGGRMAIWEPEQVQIKGRVEYGEFARVTNGKQKIDDLLRSVISHINSPVILGPDFALNDQAANEQARRDWRGKLTGELREYERSNLFRPSRISVAIRDLESALDYFAGKGTQGLLTDAMYDAFDQVPDDKTFGSTRDAGIRFAEIQRGILKGLVEQFAVLQPVSERSAFNTKAEAIAEVILDDIEIAKASRAANVAKSQQTFTTGIHSLGTEQKTQTGGVGLLLRPDQLQINVAPQSFTANRNPSSEASSRVSDTDIVPEPSLPGVFPETISEADSGEYRSLLQGLKDGVAKRGSHDSVIEIAVGRTLKATPQNSEAHKQAYEFLIELGKTNFEHSAFKAWLEAYRGVLEAQEAGQGLDRAEEAYKEAYKNLIDACVAMGAAAQVAAVEQGGQCLYVNLNVKPKDDAEEFAQLLLKKTGALGRNSLTAKDRELLDALNKQVASQLGAQTFQAEASQELLEGLENRTGEIISTRYLRGSNSFSARLQIVRGIGRGYSAAGGVYEASVLSGDELAVGANVIIKFFDPLDDDSPLRLTDEEFGYSFASGIGLPTATLYGVDKDNALMISENLNTAGVVAVSGNNGNALLPTNSIVAVENLTEIVNAVFVAAQTAREQNVFLPSDAYFMLVPDSAATQASKISFVIGDFGGISQNALRSQQNIESAKIFLHRFVDSWIATEEVRAQYMTSIDEAFAVLTEEKVAQKKSIGQPSLSAQVVSDTSESWLGRSFPEESSNALKQPLRQGQSQIDAASSDSPDEVPLPSNSSPQGGTPTVGGGNIAEKSNNLGSALRIASTNQLNAGFAGLDVLLNWIAERARAWWNRTANQGSQSVPSPETSTPEPVAPQSQAATRAEKINARAMEMAQNARGFQTMEPITVDENGTSLRSDGQIILLDAGDQYSGALHFLYKHPIMEQYFGAAALGSSRSSLDPRRWEYTDPTTNRNFVIITAPQGGNRHRVVTAYQDFRQSITESTIAAMRSASDEVPASFEHSDFGTLNVDASGAANISVNDNALKRLLERGQVSNVMNSNFQLTNTFKIRVRLDEATVERRSDGRYWLTGVQSGSLPPNVMGVIAGATLSGLTALDYAIGGGIVSTGVTVATGVLSANSTAGGLTLAALIPAMRLDLKTAVVVTELALRAIGDGTGSNRAFNGSWDAQKAKNELRAMQTQSVQISDDPPSFNSLDQLGVSIKFNANSLENGRVELSTNPCPVAFASNVSQLAAAALIAPCSVQLETIQKVLDAAERNIPRASLNPVIVEGLQKVIGSLRSSRTTLGRDLRSRISASSEDSLERDVRAAISAILNARQFPASLSVPERSGASLTRLAALIRDPIRSPAIVSGTPSVFAAFPELEAKIDTLKTVSELAKRLFAEKVKLGETPSYDEIYQLVISSTDLSKLTPNEKAIVIQILSDITDALGKMSEVRAKYPNDKDLFEHLFGRSPIGEVSFEIGSDAVGGSPALFVLPSRVEDFYFVADSKRSAELATEQYATAGALAIPNDSRVPVELRNSVVVMNPNSGFAGRAIEETKMHEAEHILQFIVSRVLEQNNAEIFLNRAMDLADTIRANPEEPELSSLVEEFYKTVA